MSYSCLNSLNHMSRPGDIGMRAQISARGERCTTRYAGKHRRPVFVREREYSSLLVSTMKESVGQNTIGVGQYRWTFLPVMTDITIPMRMIVQSFLFVWRKQFRRYISYQPSIKFTERSIKGYLMVALIFNLCRHTLVADGILPWVQVFYFFNNFYH